MARIGSMANRVVFGLYNNLDRYNMLEIEKELRPQLIIRFVYINMTTVISKHFGTSIFMESFA